MQKSSGGLLHKSMETYFLETDLSIETPAETDSPGTLSGYFVKWNTLSHPRGWGGRDVFRPGAFGDTYRGSDMMDVVALYDHNAENGYLARLDNESLKIIPDEFGARFSLRLPNTQLGRDVAWLVKNSDLKGMSFGYDPVVNNFRRESTGVIQEHIKGKLIEISVVHHPAIPNTSLELHKLDVTSDKTIEAYKVWEAEQVEPEPEAQPEPQPEEIQTTKEIDRAKRILKLMEINLK